MDIHLKIPKYFSEYVLNHNCESIEGLIEELNSSHFTTIYSVGTELNKRTQKEEDLFAIEILAINRLLHIVIDPISKGIRCIRFRTLDIECNYQKVTLENIKFHQGHNVTNSNALLFDILYKTDGLLENDKKNLSDAQVVSAWEKLVTIEEKILKRDKKEAKSIVLEELISNDHPRYVVRTKQSITNLKNSLEEVFQTNGLDINTRVEILSIINKNTIQIECHNKSFATKQRYPITITPDFNLRSHEIKRKRTAIKKIIANDLPNPVIKDLLINPSNITATTNSTQMTEFYNKNLSDSSKEVIENALRDDNIYLVQGPPGTGKTTIISEISQQLTQRGEKVLIASQANLAVDNVISNLLENENKIDDVLRIGSSLKVEDPIAKSVLLDSWTQSHIDNSLKITQDILERANNTESLSYSYADLKFLQQSIIRSENLRSFESEEQSIFDQLSIAKKYSLSYESILNSEYSDAQDLNALKHCKTWLMLAEAIHKNNNLTIDSKKIVTNQQILNQAQQNILNLNHKVQDIRKRTSEIHVLRTNIDLLNKRLQNKPDYSGFFGGIGHMFDSLTSSTPADLKKKLADQRRELNELEELRSSITIIEHDISKYEHTKRQTQEILSQYNKTYSNELIKSITQDYSVFIEVKKLHKEMSFSIFDKLTYTQVFEKQLSLKDILKKHQYAQNTLKHKTIEYKAMKDTIESTKASIVKYGNQLEDTIQRCDLTIDELTNSALEQLSKKLEAGSYDEIIKDNIELYRTFHKEVSNYNERDEIIFKEYQLSKTNKVLTTCSKCASKDFSELPFEFDTVIIDEASKALPTELFIPIINAKKLIMVGDHKQLAPFIDKEIRDNCNEEELYVIDNTLFEKLFTEAPESNKAMLNKQYRMPPLISEIVSDVFYDNQITDARQRTRVEVGNPYPQLSFFDIIEKEKRENNSYINNEEIEQIQKIMNRYENSPLSIGIISMYKGQVDLLKEVFKDKCENLEIGTVDSFQGKEKDIIILSTVRTQGKLGFIADPRRINVAISRCKESLIILGNYNTLTKDENFKKVLGYLNQEKKVA